MCVSVFHDKQKRVEVKCELQVHGKICMQRHQNPSQQFEIRLFCHDDGVCVCMCVLVSVSVKSRGHVNNT